MRPIITREPDDPENTGPEWMRLSLGRYKSASSDPISPGRPRKRKPVALLHPEKTTSCGCTVQYAKQFCPCEACR